MTQQSQLLSWGANSSGQLGLGTTSEQEPVPVPVSLPKDMVGPIKQLGGGGAHSCILDAGGVLWTCGWNHRGQCSRSYDLKSLDTFCAVTASPAWRSFSCGWDWTMTISADGEVFATGSNAFGQLGLGRDFKIVRGLTKVAGVQGIVKVSCGMRHTLFLGADGRLFGSGCGKKGQLGRGLERQFSPVSIPLCGDDNLDDPIKDIACGQYFSVVLTTSGKVIAFGDNKYGQVNGARDSGNIIEAPCVVNVGGVTHLFAGWTHVLGFNSDSGVLKSWGRNCYGQLGRQDEAPIGRVHPPDFESVCAGSEHGVAIAADRRSLCTWGWNEHGNCGNDSTEDQKHPAHILKLGCERMFERVAAASAHNFVLIQAVNE